MNRPAFDLTPFLQQDEGQHFDRDRRGHRSYVSDRGELGTDRGERGADRGERDPKIRVRVGQRSPLERRFPDTPTHAEQAYRSCGGQLPLGLSRKDPE